MVGLVTIIAIGLLLGMRHATDPDHVIAVSTIVSRERKIGRSAWIGVAWGLGHTFTIFLVGSAMISFRIELPPRAGLSMELAMAVMLILLGLRNLSALFNWSLAPIRATSGAYHTYGDYVHSINAEYSHGHGHNPLAAIHHRFGFSKLYAFARPFIIGVVHGLAGSAAIALLVLSTIAKPALAMLYLAVFGFGTVLGMMFITVMMGSTFTYGQKRFAAVDRHLGWVAGAVSLAFGLFVAYQIGIVDGLFRSQAHWTPR